MGCSHSKLRTSVVDIRGQRPQLQDSEACLPSKKMERPKTAHYKRRQSKVTFTKVKVLKKEGAPSKTNLKEVLKRPLTRHGKRERKKRSGENSSQQQAEALHYEPRPVPPEELKFTPYNLVEVDSELSLIELEPSHQDKANGIKETDTSGIKVEEDPKHCWKELELPSITKVVNLKLPPIKALTSESTSITTKKKDKKPRKKKGVTFVLPAEPSDRVDTSEASGPTSYGGACDGMVRPPTRRGMVRPSTHCEMVCPPTRHGMVRPPTRCGMVRPPTRRGMVRPSTHCEMVRPSTCYEMVCPPTHEMVQAVVPRYFHTATLPNKTPSTAAWFRESRCPKYPSLYYFPPLQISPLSPKKSKHFRTPVDDICPQMQDDEVPQKPKMERPKAAHYKRRLRKATTDLEEFETSDDDEFDFDIPTSPYATSLSGSRGVAFDILFGGSERRPCTSQRVEQRLRRKKKRLTREQLEEKQRKAEERRKELQRQQCERMRARREIRAGMDKFMASQMRKEANQV